MKLLFNCNLFATDYTRCYANLLNIVFRMRTVYYLMHLFQSLLHVFTTLLHFLGFFFCFFFKSGMTKMVNCTMINQMINFCVFALSPHFSFYTNAAETRPCLGKYQIQTTQTSWFVTNSTFYRHWGASRRGNAVILSGGHWSN